VTGKGDKERLQLAGTQFGRSWGRGAPGHKEALIVDSREEGQAKEVKRRLLTGFGDLQVVLVTSIWPQIWPN
jgi:hypothetical protein